MLVSQIVPSIPEEAIHFRNIVMGETTQLMLTIRNDGALPTTYKVHDPASLLELAFIPTIPPRRRKSSLAGTYLCDSSL